MRRIVLLFVNLLAHQTAAQGDHTKQETVATNACKAARTLQHIKQHVADQQRNKKSLVAAYPTAKRKLLAVLLVEPTAAIAGPAAAVLHSLEQQYSKLTSELAKLEEATNTSVSLLTELAEEQLQYARFLQAKVKDTDTGAGDIQQAADAQNIEVDDPQQRLANCADLEENERAATPTWLTQEKFTKLKLFELKAVPKGGAARAPLMCKRSGSQCATTNIAVPRNVPAGTNAGIVGGSIYKETEITESKLASGKFVDSSMTPEKWTTPTIKAQHAAQAIADWSTALAAVSSKIDVTNPEAFTNTPSFRESYTLATNKKIGKYDDSTDGEKAKNEIKKIYGESANEMRTKFWQKVDNTPLAGAALGTDSSGTIKDITDDKTLARVLMFYTVQWSKKLDPAATAAADKSLSDDKCKTHATEKACKSDEQCDFDEKKDPKCFLKEGVTKDKKEGKDGKTDSKCAGKEQGECEKATC
uniref:Variant surface glycoprotein n=1 Tax=Trypanosoma brucei TaxID=5691 RepID=A0A1V0FXZ7_9TRYP|nr:variant surface glycoprotein [Trypanosoma brucei]